MIFCIPPLGAVIRGTEIYIFRVREVAIQEISFSASAIISGASRSKKPGIVKQAWKMKAAEFNKSTKPEDCSGFLLG